MSIDSPNSQSSGYGAVIGFPDSFAINDLSPVSFSTPPSNNPTDGFINTHPGRLTSPGAISPSTPAAVGLFESPRLGSESEGVTSPGQLEPRFSSTWAEQSPPLTTSVSSAPLLQYQFGQQSFDNPYLGSMDQASGIGSLSAFAFHTHPVSQPISYMRHPVVASDHCSGPSISHPRDERHLSRESHDVPGSAVSCMSWFSISTDRRLLKMMQPRLRGCTRQSATWALYMNIRIN